jgi:sulfur-oxidizing protein SoxX
LELAEAFWPELSCCDRRTFEKVGNRVAVTRKHCENKVAVVCASKLRLIIPLVLVLLISGCDVGPKSAVGFRLPDGNVDAGQQLFVQLQCNNCHFFAGLELAPPIRTGAAMVTLGGSSTRIRTYGRLVSSIINPSHRLLEKYPEEEVSVNGESLMQNYNQTMTIQQLIDLVAFLQGQYKVSVPQYSYYSYKY